MSLPEHRRAFTGRTQTQRWDAITYANALTHYPTSLAARVMNAARVVVCLGGSAFIGWLLYQGI